MLQNHVDAERHKIRRERRQDRPDSEREKQELSVVIRRDGSHGTNVCADRKTECSKRNGEGDMQGCRTR